MNALDLIILAAAGWSAWSGFRTGFTQRVLSWIGFLVGAWIGTLIVPRLFEATDSRTSLDFVKALGVVVVVGTLGQTAGVLAGGHARRALTAGGLGPADAAGGIVVGLIGLLLTLWFVVPAMADVRGWPSRQARTSTIARAVDRVLGSPPSVMDGLSEAMGLDGVPDVFDSLRGAPADVPVPPDSPVDPTVIDRASRSVLKISGPACGRLVSGSGWVVAPDLVVTNAHVVAGTESVELSGTDGSRWAGRVVAFDPRADLAVVRVRGLGLAPLRVDPADRGDVGVVLGFPGGGDLAVVPYIVGEPIDARGEDIYGGGGVLRRILVLGSKVRPGESGGPLVDGEGEVAGVIFATAPDRDGVAYAIRASELGDLMSGPLERRVDVGPCV